ncbi:hypothetical protein HOY80DRAFT_998568 [Tuber brumale]|nr:hypothetical protein HOY80DRAFT_998568 [Tuber brumale]
MPNISFQFVYGKSIPYTPSIGPVPNFLHWFIVGTLQEISRREISFDGFGLTSYWAGQYRAVETVLRSAVWLSLEYWAATGLEVYPSIGVMMCYGLNIGNRLPLMKDEVTDALYTCSAIRIFLPIPPKLLRLFQSNHKLLQFLLSTSELIPTPANSATYSTIKHCTGRLRSPLDVGLVIVIDPDGIVARYGSTLPLISSTSPTHVCHRGDAELILTGAGELCVIVQKMVDHRLDLKARIQYQLPLVLAQIQYFEHKCNRVTSICPPIIPSYHLTSLVKPLPKRQPHQYLTNTYKTSIPSLSNSVMTPTSKAPPANAAKA